jgi:hypothetical protein
VEEKGSKEPRQLTLRNAARKGISASEPYGQVMCLPT